LLCVLGALGCDGGAAPDLATLGDGADVGDLATADVGGESDAPEVGAPADAHDASADASPDASPDGPCAFDENQRWQGLGGGLAVVTATSDNPKLVAMALGGDGEPVVGWQQKEKVFVSAWRAGACGGSWVALDAGSAGFFVALASAGANGPLRAVISPGQQVVVERWNGTAFAPLGAPLGAVPGRAYMVGLVADATGNPVVAWASTQAAAEPFIQAARWSGTEWTKLTDSLGIPPNSSVAGAWRHLSVAVGPDDLPIVAWTGAGATVARHVSGATWERLGNQLSLAPTQPFNGPIVNVDQTGHIYLTSMVRAEDAGGPRVGLNHLDAGMWKLLGMPVPTTVDPTDYVTILSRVGNPIVGVTDNLTAKSGGFFTYLFTAAGLQPWATPLNPRGAASFVKQPTLALDPEGRLVVAWNEEDALGFRQVYVARYRP
jgi:hypothetical protein